MAGGVSGDPDSGRDAVLPDGRVVRIRPVTPEDGPALRALHEGASGQSVYHRFFTRSREMVDRYVDRISAGAEDGHRVLVAELAGTLVGAGDCHRPPGQAEAEVAVLVADDYQHDGIGTLLLAHLVTRARRAGTCRFVAEVLTSNTRAQAVLSRSGFRVESRPPGGVLTMALETTPDRTGLPTAQEQDGSPGRDAHGARSARS